MNSRIDTLRNWLAMRSSREQWFFFAIGFALIYFFWHLILGLNLEHRQRKIQDDLVKLTLENESLQIQINTILAVVKAASYRDILTRNKMLERQSQTLNQKLKNISPNIISVDKISLVIKSILQADKGINLLSVKELKPELWISKEWMTEDIDIPLYFKEVYRYLIEIEFQADYFTALRYMQEIEKIPWPIYWDKLDYKVITYPTAKVVLKLYLLIHPQKSL